MNSGHLLTAGEAAKAVGISTAAISKAIKSGRLTYVQKTRTGYLIDPSTLFHVFRVKRLERENGETVDLDRIGDHTNEIIALRIANARLDSELSSARAVIHAERQRAESAERDRDAWRRMCDWFMEEKGGEAALPIPRKD